VRGFTKRHPGVAESVRGTYAGLASAPVVDYLRRLGITSVERMPVHAFVHEGTLVAKGLRDDWGYNSIGYVAPHNEYTAEGNSDLYAGTGRRAFASVNFVTAHNGYTLHDLVSYEQKHNEANGEENRDGTDDNRSWNCGAEGPSDDPAALACRARQKRNFLATLVLSQGVPLLLAGDETGRPQGGNNNAYTQDNEATWVDWEHGDDELREFTQRLVALRRDHPVFRRRRVFQGRAIHGTDVTDVAWFTRDGRKMSEEGWGEGFARSLGVFLNGDGIGSFDSDGNPVVDASFYVMLNAHDQPLEFVLPDGPWGSSWLEVLYTDERCPPTGAPSRSGRPSPWSAAR
jgi:isoamylase